MKIASCIVVIFFLSSCINVENFGRYWGDGTLDSAIAGKWKQKSSGEAVEFIKEDEHYKVVKNSQAIERSIPKIKTLSLEKSNFIMVKLEGNKSLYKYDIKDDIMTFYILNKRKKKKLLSLYGNENYLADEYSLTIPILNEQVVEILEEIAVKSDYWKTTEIFTRILAKK